MGLAVIVLTLVVGAHASAPTPAAQRLPDRTLRVLSANPRYFTDGSGRAVYLTGSHVWWNLAGGDTFDSCVRPRATTFSYDDYLDDLVGHGHNFVRLWTIELIRWNSCGTIVSLDFHPWARTGPGVAVDGKPRFDLRRFNAAYFARLRDRVAQAQRRGLYVSVMLFEGWSVQFEEDGWGWRGHPFNPINNVNGIDADANGDGRGLEVHSLADQRIVELQEAYVRKVVDTVNGFDNVLYEIANESSVASTPWQYRMIDLVKRYERGKRKRHPVGMTYQHGDHAGAALRASRAEWISPFAGGPAALAAPPPADGRKVVVLDTDHLCGICGDATFVWKSFLRGHNPIYMDPLDADPVRHAARVAMGQTRRYARRIDLRRARPRGDLVSTGYCLARPGGEYLAYQPETGPLSVDLGRRARTWAGEWLEPSTGRVVRFRTRRAPGRSSFRPPWSGPAVLLLRRT